MSRKTKLIHEGRYAAEIPVELIEDDSSWSPYLSIEDAAKLDTVRKAAMSLLPPNMALSSNWYRSRTEANSVYFDAFSR
jgi:hypothetical protein